MEQIQRYDDEAPVLAGAAASQLRYRRLVARCAAIVGCAMLLVMAFVAVIDPYHLYGFVDSTRLNHVKPVPEQYREQIKLAQATAARPDLVLLGNSRVEAGLDPDSPQLSGHGRSAYNLALAGATLAVNERMYAALRTDAAPAAMAVIGVEFLDFLVEPDRTPPQAPAAGPFSWQWRFDTLLSIQSVTDALRTVRLQKADDPPTMTQRGQTPLRDYNRYARAQGYDAIFQRKAADNARNIVRKPHNLFVAGTDGSPSIDRLRVLLDTMARDRTEVHLVIYPYHAQMMAMFDEAGLAPAMEAWKQVLVREVDAVRGRYPSARISVWDFSGYAAMRCERIPAPGDSRTATRWYWDAGHFKSALGERMLQRILGDETPFGVRLAAGNLDANRRRIAAERSQCAAAYPQVFAGAHDLIAAARASSR